MRTSKLALLFPLVLVACSSGEDIGAAASAANDGKADVCHAGARLNVDDHAISAHLAHGDHLPFDAWPDADGDGHGDAEAAAVSVCALGAGQVTNHDDCDDAHADVNPAAKEVCGNGIDDTCDGKIDEGCAVACTIPPLPAGACGCYCGHMSESRCAEFGWKWDGKNAACVGAVMTADICAALEKKHHGDGSGSDVYNLGVSCSLGFDANACDPKVDKGCCPVWPDADGDGYGDATAASKGVHEIGPGLATNNGDCNDFASSIHPGAAEVCGNFADDNCDGSVDEGCSTPPACKGAPPIPSGVCGCYCGFMSKANCALFGWTWDDANGVCLGGAMTSADCDVVQAKHAGDGSGKDVYDLGVTCTVGK